MQKTFLYLLILVLLGAAAWYFVFKKNDNVFGNKEAGFTIEDTASVGRIYMVRTSGESITLQRTDTGWMVNGANRALLPTVNMLLTTMLRQVAQHPVPDNMHNSVVKTMSGNSVKVEVYDRESNKIRVFYVGSEGFNSDGSFMLMEGAEKPYLVQIPGFEGFLTPRYSTNLADWRDRTVFSFRPDEIRSVSVNYSEEPLNSFTIKQDSGRLTVETAPGIPGSNPLNQKRAESYLKFFDGVYCEGYLNGAMHLPSLLAASTKRCAIDVVSRQGKARHVDVYWMPVTRRSKNQLESDDTPDAFDSDRFYGVMNNLRDTVILQRATFDKLFRKAYEFYEADKPIPVLGISKHKRPAPDTSAKDR